MVSSTRGALAPDFHTMVSVPNVGRMQMIGFLRQVTANVAAMNRVMSGKARLERVKTSLSVTLGRDTNLETRIVPVNRPTGALVEQAYVQTEDGFNRGCLADLRGDGRALMISVSGPGQIAEVVIREQDGREVARFRPFGDFRGGLYVSAGDMDGDGREEFVVTPDVSGGPRVSVFRLESSGAIGRIADFFGIDDTEFRGGCRAAISNNMLVVAAGYGGGPRVAAYLGHELVRGRIAKWSGDFFSYEDKLRNGVFVAAGDLNKDGVPEIVTAAGPGGGPRVSVFTLINGVWVETKTWFASPRTDLRGGARVDTVRIGTETYITVGPGQGDSGYLTVYDLDGNLLAQSGVSGSPFTDGAYVSAADRDGNRIDEIAMFVDRADGSQGAILWGIPIDGLFITPAQTGTAIGVSIPSPGTPVNAPINQATEVLTLGVTHAAGNNPVDVQGLELAVPSFDNLTYEVRVFDGSGGFESAAVFFSASGIIRVGKQGGGAFVLRPGQTLTFRLLVTPQAGAAIGATGNAAYTAGSFFDRVSGAVLTTSQATVSVNKMGPDFTVTP